MGNEFSRRTLVFIDTETLGLNPEKYEIIELAAIKTDSSGKEIQEEFYRKFKPKFPDVFEPKAAEVNGYNPKTWDGKDLLDSSFFMNFSMFCGESVAVCQNPIFDRSFIEHYRKLVGAKEFSMDYHWVDTMSIAMPLIKKNNLLSASMRSICTMLGVPPEPDVHGAIKGARTCRLVYLDLMDKLTPLDKPVNLEFNF